MRRRMLRRRRWRGVAPFASGLPWLLVVVVCAATFLRQGASGPVTAQPAAAASYPIDAKAYGVSADAPDNAAALQAALDLAGRAGGATVRLPPGVLKIVAAGPVSVPSNTSLQGQGRGATVLRVVSGRTTPVLDVDGKSNVRLADFTIEVAETAPRGEAKSGAARGTAYGVQIRGAAADVVLERLTIDRFVRGVQVAGGEGSTPGVCRRLAFRTVTCNGSPANFGFNLDDCDTVLLDDCYGRGNWLDGVKLRKRALNVTVRGGAFTGNGTGGAGDGIDAYAGGDTFTVDGTVLDRNSGNGITIKTGALNQTSGDAYGTVRNARLVNLCCRDNSGMGVYLTLNDPPDKTQRLVDGAVVDGGVFEGNESGIYVSARNVSINHPLVRNSRRHGIVVAARAFDVEVNHPVCVANGTEAAGAFSGLAITGASQVAVNGGLFVGAGDDAVATDADLKRAAPVTRYGVLVADGSDRVYVSWPTGHHLGGRTVENEAKAGLVLVDQRGEGEPEGAAFGSVGSLYRRELTGGVNTGHLSWRVKAAGGPAEATGWAWMVQGAPVNRLPPPSQALRGLILSLRAEKGGADGLYQCVKRANDTYAWRALLGDEAGMRRPGRL